MLQTLKIKDFYRNNAENYGRIRKQNANAKASSLRLQHNSIQLALPCLGSLLRFGQSRSVDATACPRRTSFLLCDPHQRTNRETCPPPVFRLRLKKCISAVFEPACHVRIQTTLDLYTQGDGDETRAAQGAFLREMGLASELVQ